MKRAISVLLVGLALIYTPQAAAETIGELFRRVNPSVVVIRAHGRDVEAAGEFRFHEVGAGVFISEDGKVLTAAHVVQAMDEVLVEILGEDPIPARVVRSEPGADLSLLQVDRVPTDIVVASLANSDAVLPGDQVIVVGAPYGLSHAVSFGIISARWEPNTINREFPLAEFLQTDAAINTGNSGGPMFNMAGAVIGVVSHIISKSGGNEGLGFVVSSNSVKKLLLQQRAFWSGIEGRVISGELAAALKVPQPVGFLVKTVAKNSPGEAVGLRGGNTTALFNGQEIVVGGDIVLKVLGIPIESAEDWAKIRRALSDLPPGDELTVTVLRSNRVIDLKGRWAR